MKVLKAVSQKRGNHIHTVYSIGNEGQTLANIGTLVTEIGEWQIIGAALLLGAERTKGRLKVICEGDEEICNDK